MEHGEMDKGGLKQLRWVHAQIHDPKFSNSLVVPEVGAASSW